MRNKVKNYLSQPYTKGDYANGIVCVLGAYIILGGVWIAMKVAEAKKYSKKYTTTYDEPDEEDEEA